MLRRLTHVLEQRDRLAACENALDEARATIVHVGCDKECVSLRRENCRLRHRLRSVRWVLLAFWAGYLVAWVWTVARIAG